MDIKSLKIDPSEKSLKSLTKIKSHKKSIVAAPSPANLLKAVDAFQQTTINESSRNRNTTSRNLLTNGSADLERFEHNNGTAGATPDFVGSQIIDRLNQTKDQFEKKARLTHLGARKAFEENNEAKKRTKVPSDLRLPPVTDKVQPLTNIAF